MSGAEPTGDRRPSPGGATEAPQVVRPEGKRPRRRVDPRPVNRGHAPGGQRLKKSRRLPEPPRRVRDRMAAGERLLMPPLRQHPVVLVRPTAIVFGALVLIYLVTSAIDYAAPFTGLLGLAWLGLLFWGIVQWVEHYVDYVVVTQKRVMRVRGIIPGVAMLPIGRVTDFKYERGILGALLGYGTFILESAGQVQALRELEYVRQPNRVYEVIVSALYASE